MSSSAPPAPLRPVGAFEFLELLIYGYAVIRFFLDVLGAFADFLLSSSNHPDTEHALMAADVALLGFIFIAVVARNYIVMQSIDHKDYTEGESYIFLDRNEPWFRRAEKSLRFLIVFVVIVTPRHSSDFIRYFTQPPVNAVRFALESGVSLWMRLMDSVARDALHLLAKITGDGRFDAVGAWVTARSTTAAPSGYHDTLGYYGGLLFILFLLFVLWDLVNVAALRRRMRSSPPLDLNIEGEDPKDSDYLSTMMYLNVYRLIDEDHGGSPRFGFRGLKTKKHFDKFHRRDAVYMYWRSPKLRERLFLLLCSLCVIGCSLTNANVTSFVFMLVAICFYFYFARRNLGYLHDFLELARMFRRYFATT